MCFVWIWEQTAIISLYSINWLVSVTEIQCVYCAVQTGSLNQINSYSSLEGLNVTIPIGREYIGLICEGTSRSFCSKIMPNDKK